MFTLNLSSHAETAPQKADLLSFVNGYERFWVTQAHSELMRKTASPARMRHLQQVIEHEYELPRPRGQGARDHGGTVAALGRATAEKRKEHPRRRMLFFL